MLKRIDNWQAPVAVAPTGQRVLVVGAGPSGLSAAYHLTRLCHPVTIKDAGRKVSGNTRPARHSFAGAEPNLTHIEGP